MTIKAQTDAPVCPRLAECAHPRGGTIGHRGRCVDCGHQLATSWTRKPTSRGGAAIASLDYDGRAAA